MEKRLCKQCDKELTKRQKFYCSKSCKAKSEGTKHMNVNRPSKITKKCDWCGNFVKERNSRRFCSRECYSQWWASQMVNNQHALGAVRTEEFKQNLSKIVKGENNPMFGVIGEQHPSWKDEKVQGTWISRPIRREVLERDNYSCKICSDTENLHVHHIEPYGISSDSTASNLIVLCQGCHSDTHRLYLKQANYSDFTDKQIAEFKDYLRNLIGR